MQLLKTISEVQAYRKGLSQANKRLGFVPTMGALHRGHLSLVGYALEKSDHCLVSIFVNPTQFSVGEDFDKYPKQISSDLQELKKAGVKAVFLPSVEEMYEMGHEIKVVVDSNDILCGKSRPEHFSGVLTVVSKLFNIVRPDVAVFGKKDYQQLSLIRRLNDSLNFGVEIIGAPILREESGLAMSSRNLYMNDVDRRRAAAIFRGLSDARSAYLGGEKSVQVLKDHFLLSVSGMPNMEIDYTEIYSSDLLNNYTQHVGDHPIFLVALHFAGVRLIDNLELHSNEL